MSVLVIRATAGTPSLIMVPVAFPWTKTSILYVWNQTQCYTFEGLLEADNTASFVIENTPSGYYSITARDKSRLQHVARLFVGPATAVACDCGALKVKTTHSTWCSTAKQGDLL